jgi:alpha-L-rhamnosidase
MKKHIAYFKSKTKDLICPVWGYTDCCRIDDKMTPLPLVNTGYLAHIAELMSCMAEAIGEKADAETYRNLHEAVSEAFQKTFVAADGKIEGDAQGSYVVPIAFRLLTPTQEKQAAAHLARLFATDFKNVCGYGYSCPNTILRALQKIGRTDLAYQLLLSKEFPSLGYEVGLGATTIWEHWDGYVPGRGFLDSVSDSSDAFNQCWSGSSVEWFYEGILGINPAESGYAKILIAPQPGGGLTYAKGHYDSVRGRIAVEWHIKDRQFNMRVTAPADVPTTVMLPDGSKKEMNGTSEFACEMK